MSAGLKSLASTLHRSNSRTRDAAPRSTAAAPRRPQLIIAAMQPAVADGPNVLADIKRDHAQFFAIHRQMSAPNCGDEERQTLVWQLIHDLAVHSLAEEEVLYPRMKDLMGSKCRDHALAEHKTLKNLLSDIDAMTIHSPGFGDKLETLMFALKHHIKEEEDEMLPEFASHVDRNTLAELSHKFTSAKKHVPTRPHPAAPDKPVTGNIVGNLLTAPIDKIRDAVRFGSMAGAPGGTE